MNSLLTRPRIARRKTATLPTAERPPRLSDDLAENLDRLQSEEQIERDRRREEEHARLQDLARFD